MRRIISNILLLFCLSSFQLAAELVSLPGLINPDSITVDNHYIYITDRETIYIFSVVDFKLKTKFGKEGEGPIEFKIYRAGTAKLQVDIQPGTIIVNSNSRVTFFTKDGKYLKEVQIRSGNNFKQIGDHYVGYSTSRESKILFLTINLYDSTFNKLKEIFRKEYYVQPNKKFNLVKLGCGNARRAVYTVYNEKIFVEGEKNVIHVFNKEGNEQYVIKLNYERLKVSETHKEEIRKDLYTFYTGSTMQKLIKEKGYFPEYFTARIFNHDYSNDYGQVPKIDAGASNYQLCCCREGIKNKNSDTYDNPYDSFYHVGLLNWQIINCLKENPNITYDELANELKKNRDIIKNNIKKLRLTHLVERIGSKKAGHWEVKTIQDNE